MHRGFRFLIVLAILAASCGNGEAETTAESQFPTGSVRSWLDALEAGDSARALELTYQESMLVILAAENGLETPQIASLLRRGATEESAARYLSEFGAALRTRYGASLAEVSVDGFMQLGETYAAVEVTGQGAATIITRRAPGGLWQIDLVGTLGPALISQIRAILEKSGDGEDAETIAAEFAAGVIPALDAAAAADPEDLALASEILLIKSRLGT